MLLLISPGLAESPGVTVTEQPGFAKVTVTFSGDVTLLDTGVKLYYYAPSQQVQTLCRLNPLPETTMSSSFDFKTCDSSKQPASISPGTYSLDLTWSDVANRQSTAVLPFSVYGPTIEEDPADDFHCDVLRQNQGTKSTGLLRFTTKTRNNAGESSPGPTYCVLFPTNKYSLTSANDVPKTVAEYQGLISPHPWSGFDDRDKQTLHEFTNFAPSPVTLLCSETIDTTPGKQTNERFLIGQRVRKDMPLALIATAPKITDVKFIPDKLTSAADPTDILTFTTNQESICRLKLVPGTGQSLSTNYVYEDGASGTNTNPEQNPLTTPNCTAYTAFGTLGTDGKQLHTFKLPLTGQPSFSAPNADVVFTYEVTCKNKALLEQTQTLDPLVVNFGDDVTIKKLTPPNLLVGAIVPPATSAWSDLVLAVKPLLADAKYAPKAAQKDGCYVGVPADKLPMSNDPALDRATKCNALYDGCKVTSPTPGFCMKQETDSSSAAGEHDQKFTKSYKKAEVADGPFPVSVTCCFTKPDGAQLVKTDTFAFTVNTATPKAPTVTTTGGVCQEDPSKSASVFNTITALFNRDPTDTKVTGFNYTVTYKGKKLVTEKHADIAPDGTATGTVVNSSLLPVTPAPAYPPIPPGEKLKWEVYAIDDVGNKGAVTTSEVNIHAGAEEECTFNANSFITLKAPMPVGYSTAPGYAFQVQTARSAGVTCSYATVENPVDASYIPFGSSQCIPDGTSGKKTCSLTRYLADEKITIKCMEAVPASNPQPAFTRQHGPTSFCAGYVSGKTPITPSGVPTAIRDESQFIVALKVHTRDPTLCTISGPKLTGSEPFIGEQGISDATKAVCANYLNDHSKQLVFDQSMDSADTSVNPYRYAVTCVNKAGTESTQEIPILINLRGGIVITPTSPANEGYVGSGTFEYKMTTDTPAACTWVLDPPVSGATPKSFTADASNMQFTYAFTPQDLSTPIEKTHHLNIHCISRDGSKVGDAITTFTVDPTPPTFTGLDGPDMICPQDAAGGFYALKGIVAVAQSKDLIIKYNISKSTVGTVFKAPGEFSPAAPVLSEMVNVPLFTAKDDYILSVIIGRQGGTPSTPVKKTIKMAPATDVGCTGSSLCRNGRKDEGEEAIDCGGTSGCKPCDDGSAVTAPIVTTTNYVCNGKLNASFTTADTDIVSYDYVVKYDGVEKAKATIPFPANKIELPAPIAESAALPYGYPQDKSITWAVTATDWVGNKGPTTTTSAKPIRKGTEEECTGTKFINLVSPTPLDNVGYAQSPPAPSYAFEISTKRQAICYYHEYPGDQTEYLTWPKFPVVDGQQAPGTPGTKHKIPDLMAPSRHWSVVCMEGTSKFTNDFTVGYQQKPTLSVTATRDLITDGTNTAVRLTAHTDQPSVCVIDGPNLQSTRFGGETTLNFSKPDSYKQDHTIDMDFSSGDTDIHRNVYTVTCKNYAQQEVSMQKTIVVHFGATFTFVVMSPETPPAYVSSNAVTITVKLNTEGQSCTWESSTPTSGATPVAMAKDSAGYTFTTNNDLPPQAKGGHEYIVSCVSADGTKRAVQSVTFTVDDDRPVLTSLVGPPTICPADQPQFTLGISTLDQSPTVEYSLVPISGSGGATFQASNNGQFLAINPAGMLPGNYLLKVRIMNRAGVASDPNSPPSGTVVRILSSTDNLCTYPAYCRNGVLDSAKGEAKIDCSSSGGACPSCRNCDCATIPSGDVCSCIGTGACGCAAGERCIDFVCTVGDYVPPLAPTITPSDVICDGAVSASFTAVDSNAGGGIRSYNYSVSDSTGLIGKGQVQTSNVKVLLPAASTGVTGTLTWTVFATDTARNDGPSAIATVSSVRVGEDGDCGRPPFIKMVKPPVGYAVTQPYTVELSTVSTAVCRYASVRSPWSTLTTMTETPSGMSHTTKTLSGSVNTLFVSCREPTSVSHNRTFSIGVDGTKPVFVAAEFNPNPLIDRAFIDNVLLNVTTDDPTYCMQNGAKFEDVNSTDFSSYKRVHTKTLSFSTITDTTRHELSYAFACMNLAQTTNTATRSLVVNFGATMKVTVVSPASYVGSSTVVLAVNTSKRATCTAKDSDGITTPLNSETMMLHNVTLTNLADGSHQYVISCIATDAGSGDASVRFLVDTKLPEATLTGPAFVCKGAADMVITTKFTNTLDAQPVPTYALLRGSSVIFVQNGIGTRYIINQSNLSAENHTIRVNVTTSTGLKGNKTGNFTFRVLLSTDPFCTGENTCLNNKTDVNEVDVDCGGPCPECIMCKLQPTAVAGVSGAGDSNTTPLDVAPDATPACGVGQYCNGRVCQCSEKNQMRCGDTCTSILTDNENCGICGNSCGSGASCSNGMCCGAGTVSCNHACVDLGGSNINCGSCGHSCSSATTCSGGACTGCTKDADCSSGEICFNETATCMVLHCTTGKQDSDEQGVDCGGADCAACKVCAMNADCGIGELCDNTTSTCIKTNGCRTSDDCATGEQCIENVCQGLQPGGCRSEADCPSDNSCVEGVCQVSECKNGIKDSKEEYTDCGGDCGPCKMCTVDAECAPKFCGPDNVCVPRVSTCHDGEQNGKETGVDCGGPICDACGKPKSNACSNGVKDAGEEDVDCGGTCSTPCSPVEPPAKSHLLSILLLAVGIALMGGAGYFLYYQNTEKKEQLMQQQAMRQQQMPQQRMRMAPTPAASAPITPELAAKYAQEQKARQEALRKEYEARAAQKEEERKKMFGGFPGATGQAARPVEQTYQQPNVQQSQTTQQTSQSAQVRPQVQETRRPAQESKPVTDEDGFVDLSSVGKKKDATQQAPAQSKTAAQSPAQSPEKKKPDAPKEDTDDDAFSDLDKL